MKPSALRREIQEFCDALFDNIIDHILIKETLYSECVIRCNRLLTETQQTFSWKIEKLIAEVADLSLQDVDYMMETDPATHSIREVVFAYPWIYALALQRFAHALHTAGVEIIPRMMTELAHSKTGIDIHPGTQIWHHIAIDHGTWIVIGETAIIGNYIRFYHNVSLWNLSVKKSQEWAKRHPTIEDHVTIYAGAIILGGQTVVWEHSTIWWWAVITSSVEPHSLVTTQYTTNYYSKHDKEEYAHIQITDR